MSKFTLLINVQKRLWYWPFIKRNIEIPLPDKARVMVIQDNFENPVLVEVYADRFDKLTTTVSCGNDDDGVKKVRFKLVSDKDKR